MSTFLDPFDDATPPAPRPKGRAKPPAPSPQPPPAPASSPSPSGPASHPANGYSLRHVILAVVAGVVGAFGLLALLILASAWVERGPAPAPKVDGVRLGRAFVKPLAASLAESIEGEAAAVEGKTPLGKANTDSKTAFRAALNKAFADGPAAEFARVLPEGEEPKDDAQRAEFVRLLRDFAKGLRGGK